MYVCVNKYIYMDTKNKTKKRCPKGQRRNKKTGRCKKYTKPESKPKLVIKKEKTPIEADKPFDKTNIKNNK